MQQSVSPQSARAVNESRDGRAVRTAQATGSRWLAAHDAAVDMWVQGPRLSMPVQIRSDALAGADS